MIRFRTMLGRTLCFGIVVSVPLVGAAAPPQILKTSLLQTNDRASCPLAEIQAPLNFGQEITKPVPVIIWPDCAVSCGNPYCVGGKDMDPCYTEVAPGVFSPGYCTPTNNTCGEIHRSRCECMASPES